MAAFRIGQRVRILRFNGSPHLIGKEATLLKFYMHGQYPSWWLNVDGIGYTDPLDGCAMGAWEADIEPIQPERNQVIPWSECLWQPGNIGEPA